MTKLHHNPVQNRFSFYSSMILLHDLLYSFLWISSSLNVVSSSSDTIFVGQGGEALLPCQYEGELSSRLSGAVSWVFEQKSASARPIATAWHPSKQIQPKIEDSAFEGHVGVSSTPGSASLSLIDFHDNMEGSYKCSLTLENRESKEFDYTVRLAVLRRPVLNGDRGFVIIKENQETTVKCEVYAFPPPTISWRLNGNPVPAEEVVTTPDSQRRDMYVSAIQISARRTQQDETVDCIVDGPALSTVPNLRQEWPNGRMESAPLNILYPPDAPYITLEENQWFYTGTILALGCSVSDRGNPPVMISMVFPDLQFAETRTSSFVHKSFRLLQTYNGEDIVCTAKSEIEELTQVTKRTLKVAYGPMSVEIEGDKDVAEDSPVGIELQCRAFVANPRASITWSGFRPEVAKVVNQTKLILKPTWRDNGAKILCTGSNPYSEDATKNVIDSVILNVKHSPKWNGTEESKIVRKYAGQEALLTCNVVANPSKELTFVWYFNGEEVDAGDVREKKVRADASTFGVYTCRAGNAAGSSDFSLELVDAALIDQEGAQFKTALVAGVVASILICIILLLIIVYCLRNRRSPDSLSRSPSYEDEKRRDGEEENHDDTPSNGKPANNNLIYSDVEVITPTKEPNANNPLIKSYLPPTEYATIDLNRNGGTPAHRRPFGGVPVIVGMEGAHRLMKSTPI